MVDFALLFRDLIIVWFIEKLMEENNQRSDLEIAGEDVYLNLISLLWIVQLFTARNST